MDLQDLNDISPIILPMVFMLVALAIICITAIICVLIVARGKRKRDQKQNADDKHLIREIHQEVLSLANRINTLETIIIEHNESPPHE